MIMSAEIVTMLGVGIALALFVWRVFALLDKRMDRLEDKVDGFAGRLARLEGAVELLTKFLVDRDRGHPTAAE